MDKRIVGWLIEPIDDNGKVITWIKHFPQFLSRLDAPDGPMNYGPQFKVTPLVRLNHENQD